MLLITGKKFRQLRGELENLAYFQEQTAMNAEEIRSNLTDIKIYTIANYVGILCGIIIMGFLIKRLRNI